MADDSSDADAKLGRLEDCALRRRTIRLTCPRCRNVRRYDAVALWWLFQRRRWSDEVPACTARFRCSRCSSLGRAQRPRLEITRDQPDAEQPPYPDERVWKRLVARYRS